MTTKLKSRRQLAMKLEGTEGTAETLAAADAKLLVYDQKVSYDPQFFERKPSRVSTGKIKKSIGKVPAKCEFSFELRGSGVATTEPEWTKVLKGCGCKVSALYAITIGAVTSGPFTHNEVITGGTSGAKGRVMAKTATGTTTLYFVLTSGTFQSGEVLTGGTSGATATSGSTAAQVGFVAEKDSTSPSSYTIGSYEDGIRKLIRGSRGTFKMSAKIGEPFMVYASFLGAEAGVTDTALLSNVTQETTTPPIFINASITHDSLTSFVLTETEFDLAQKLAVRDNANALSGGGTRGITSCKISDCDPIGSFDPELLDVATHDFHTKWFDGVEMYFDALWGATAGNKFRLIFPRIQYRSIEDADKDGRVIAQCQFDINGALSDVDQDSEFALFIY